MKDLKKVRSALRLVFIGLLLIFLIYLIKKYAVDLVKVLEHGDMTEIENYIEEQGKNALWVIVVLQVLQTITVFFPGIPIYMCSGIVFGKLKGTIVCYITYVVVNMCVFVFARKVKESANDLLDNKYDEQLSFLKKKIKNPMIFTMVLCIIPLVPNGIVPYIASNSGLTFKKFLISVAIGCLPGIFLFVCCGELLMSKYFMIILVILAVVTMLSVFSVLFKKKKKS